MRYEGVVTSDGRTFPTVRRRLYVTEGTETVDRPLALTPVDKASAQSVDASAGPLHVDFAGRYPGLAVEVPANGLFFADGSVRGVLTATEVAGYALPVPMEGRSPKRERRRRARRPRQRRGRKRGRSGQREWTRQGCYKGPSRWMCSPA